MIPQKQVTIRYSNGDHTVTRVNGYDSGIRAYYRIGKVVNIGGVTDNLVRIIKITIEEVNA